MTRKRDTFTAHEDSATFAEIDLAEMESVSGGCQNCGCASGANGGTTQLAAMLPLLASQNRRR